MNGFFLGYKCSLCGQEYVPAEVQYTCPKDGGNLDVVLDTIAIRKNYQIEDILASTEPSLWRYVPLLPVGDPGGIATPLRAAGWTPVFSPAYLAEKLGIRYLWIKDESRNPTASFKDRASSVVVARAREIGAKLRLRGAQARDEAQAVVRRVTGELAGLAEGRRQTTMASCSTTPSNGATPPTPRSSPRRSNGSSGAPGGVRAP